VLAAGAARGGVGPLQVLRANPCAAAKVERARRDLLDGCLAKLREPQRDLLRRCYEGTHAIKEIAADMRISAAALTMRLQRIKQAVLGCLEKSLAAEGRR
jgi:DNA-directed RNA polymerase specialized sigma24 family protein